MKNENLFMIDDLTLNAIDQLVEKELNDQYIPGIAMAIINNGHPVHVRGYGVACIEHSVAVRPDTLFQTGSVGKMFTAALAMKLVESGELDLEQSVSHYLNEAPAQWENVTLRNLLNHTSGMGLTTIDYKNERSDEEYLNLFYNTPFDFMPGERWSYSNEGYSMLGFIINRVTGNHYGELLRKLIFSPAGMNSAQIICDRKIIPNRAVGYEVSGNEIHNQDWVSASMNRLAEGSLYMSLFDYLAWDRVVANRGLLQTSSWQQILAPAKLTKGGDYPYGFGWTIERSTHSPLIIGHGGAWQGFKTALRRYDSEGISFVVLANSSVADVNSILQGVANLFNASFKISISPVATDLHPDFTHQVEKMLYSILPDISGKSLLADFLKGSGFKQIVLTGEQPNGNYLEREYMIRLSDNPCILILDVTFDITERRLVSSQISTRSTDDTRLLF